MSVHLQTNITSFSNDDGDGSKHVTMNTNSNLYIVDAFISTRFKCWSLIQSSKRGEKCLRVFTFSKKRRIRNFTSYSCSYGKEMNKKACSTSEIVVCLLDLLLLIVTFSLPSRSSLLQLPIGSTSSRLPGREKRKRGHLFQYSLAMTGSPLNKWLQFSLKILNIAVPSSVLYKLGVLWKVLEMTASQQRTVQKNNLSLQ